MLVTLRCIQFFDKQILESLIQYLENDKLRINLKKIVIHYYFFNNKNIYIKVKKKKNYHTNGLYAERIIHVIGINALNTKKNITKKKKKN